MTNFNFSKILSAFLAIGLVSAACSAQSLSTNIVKRPEELKFAPLVYNPPNPAQFRVALKSGPIAYVVPDRELPLVKINVLVKTGRYLTPPGKEGLAELTGYLLTRGGTESKSAEDLEERLAFLAAQLTSSIGDTQGSVSLNLLTKDLDEGLSILREVLTKPRFQADKLALRKQQLLQEMKQRNDQSEDIETREYGFLARGEQFWANRYATQKSIESITQADLKSFHQAWFHPDDFVVAVSGDFDSAAMIAKLEKLFSGWPFGNFLIEGTAQDRLSAKQPPPIPTNAVLAKSGVYFVNKDVNQGRVSIILPGIQRNDPDYFNVQIMNDILGGGGFTSHIMSSVRSDEGLAYSAYSSFPGGIYYPLNFTAAYQSKSRSVTYAASIVLKEMKKMTEAPPTPKELSIAKHGYIDRFPTAFATKDQIANQFAQDEFTGRYATNPDYWKNYRSRIEAVTADDVLRVARKYLAPEKSVILIVGDKNEISKKMADHPVSLEDLLNAPITELPLRDPLTMQPLSLSKQ